MSAGFAHEVPGVADGAAAGQKMQSQTQNQLQHYCTPLRERPPATDVWVNRHTAFGAIQAANNTAGAGDEHGHRRCRDSEGEERLNVEEGPGLNQPPTAYPSQGKKIFWPHVSPETPNNGFVWFWVC